jgi:hypothetical protein
MNIRMRSLFAAALVAAASVATPASSPDLDRVPVSYELGRGHVVTYDGSARSCREATFEETEEMNARAPGEELAVLNPWKLEKARRGEAAGLTIVLRGTAQLDSFPQAKAAYIRAAESWEALVRTPITILIDVDFGPKRFGVTFPSNVLGSTNSQFGRFAYNWSGVRARLIQRANSAEETALLAQLPPSTGIPTTEGNATLVYIPSATQRALGLIDPVYDEAGEQADLGPPPSIGFNSAFAYDFDPTNGIDSNKQDFNATALHEIGHALGFSSHTGLKELIPSQPVVVTTWDLFRFRPGVSLSTFPSAQRVTSSGGEQIEFVNGASTSRLSTGRPDGTGGDGNQASHWKDNVLNSGVYVGIMDPSGADGDKDQLTAIDLQTLDLIGYDVRGLVSFDGVGVLDGNTLTLSGNGVVANLVLASARVALFDAAGSRLADLPATPINAAGNAVVPITLEVPGLEGFLTATAAEVTLVDDAGHASEPVRVEFGAADAGAGTIAARSASIASPSSRPASSIIRSAAGCAAKYPDES